MGTPADMERQNILCIDTTAIQNLIDGARRSVFRKGFALNSKKILDPKSLVTTRSAFSQRLSKFGFNFYSMFVPDLLHEFELGVWKAVFTHLLCILYAEGKDRIQILNKRFRLVPTFGRDTIRHFTNNVSAMKQLAARDFEDILQCIIPVLDMLLPPEHNEVVLTLLFELATWHALAKLHLHTEDTLTVFTRVTESLGNSLRAFVNTTCEAYDTQELPKEHAARGRHTAAMRERGSVVSNRKKSSSGTANELLNGPKIKKLNLSTYKLHALADYPQAIRQFGMTDNYSTQVGELEHRHGKRWYARTNKNKHVGQIAKHERRAWLLHHISQDEQRRAHEEVLHESTAIAGNATSSISRAGGCSHLRSGVAAIKMTTNIPLPKHSSPFDHYHMSDYTPVWENIPHWLKANKDDRAFENFIPLLKNHLLSRLMGREFDGDENEFTPEEHATLKILENKIYFHKVVRVNYTTYDMRRDQDTINPRTHPDVMVLAHEDDQDHNANTHPYWNPFGFLDPDNVLRAVHLIPAFADGRTDRLLGSSSTRQIHGEDDMDYENYYVNMDMFMRYLGGGVGHKGSMSQIITLPPASHPTERAYPPISEKRAAQQNLELTYEAEANNTEGEEEDDDSGEEEHVADMRLIEEELDYGYQVAEDEADERCEDEEGNGGGGKL
ncbi:hypothetical protein WOLCODRAFT_154510 [Wolfiporia cocos MD-104 SS10]|uniref:Uncharacterized protein n=1 Tax=Wolfiporia cocos (strain MD-104) TaxID=742152 RepID=A0A2H3K7Q9_WOLCO|nr:hypothetical protein WOLCODRAFT_154510 [Wolfiporia cocos MD-104 SS10]